MSAGAGLNTMATIADTILTSRQAAHAWQPIAFTRTSAATPVVAGVYSGSREMVTTDAAGDFSIVLSTGTYDVNWRVQGHWNRLQITVPTGDGTYSFEDLADDGGTVYPDLQVQWFTTVDDMLAEDAATWTNGRVRDTYGSGTISGWEFVPKESTPAVGLADNGDSIRETTDGLGYAVRAWIAG